MRVYLDNCSIQRPLDDQSSARIRLETEAILTLLALCESGHLKLVSSDASGFEAIRNPHPVRRDFSSEVLALSSQFVAVDDEVRRRARQLLSRGLKALDALHLACAIEGGADFFCTCDDRLLNARQRLDTGGTQLVSPPELIQEIS
jgi:predicted nucleic acid-binding protein